MTALDVLRAEDDLTPADRNLIDDLDTYGRPWEPDPPEPVDAWNPYFDGYWNAPVGGWGA